MICKVNFPVLQLVTFRNLIIVSGGGGGKNFGIINSIVVFCSSLHEQYSINTEDNLFISLKANEQQEKLYCLSNKELVIYSIQPKNLQQITKMKVQDMNKICFYSHLVLYSKNEVYLLDEQYNKLKSL